MSNNSIKATIGHLAKVSNDETRMLGKEEKVQDDFILVKTELEVAEVELHQCEKRFINDEATQQELDAARSKVKVINEKLAELKRLGQLVSEELKRIKGEIQQATQQVQVSRRDFCHSRRDEIFSSIQNDNKLKEKLLEAIAAFALNGYDHYTSNWQAFINQFVHQVLPKATPEEIKESIAKFSKTHDLPS